MVALNLNAQIKGTFTINLVIRRTVERRLTTNLKPTPKIKVRNIKPHKNENPVIKQRAHLPHQVTRRPTPYERVLCQK